MELDMRTGDFSWHELLTDDIEGAKKFYKNMFGWTFREAGMSTEYWVFNDGRDETGGIMNRPEGTPEMSVWTAYVTVGDLNATIAKVKSLGGQIPVGPIELDEIGKFAVIEDPQGAFIHAIEYLPSADAGDSDDAGCSAESSQTPDAGQFCWYTLMTTEVAKAKNFYEMVFDWKLVEAPDGGGNESLTVTNGGSPIAGVMAAQGGQPPAWGISITVDDVDAAATQVKKHGGKVIMGPMPAGKIGRNTIIADSAGSVVSLFEANMEEMNKMMKNFSV